MAEAFPKYLIFLNFFPPFSLELADGVNDSERFRTPELPLRFERILDSEIVRQPFSRSQSVILSTADIRASRDPAPLFLYIPLGILLNLGGAFLNDLFSLPIFLDSGGTLLAAVVIGPWLGAATGFLSNLIIGLVETPISIPFGLVNAAIGLIAGWTSRRWGFRDPRVVAGLVLALTVVCPLLATPIVVFLFGGVSGSAIDRYWAVMIHSGHQVFSSAFLVRLPANFADKLVSAGLVWAVLRLVPVRWRGLAEPAAPPVPPDDDSRSEPDLRA